MDNALTKLTAALAVLMIIAAGMIARTGNANEKAIAEQLDSLGEWHKHLDQLRRDDIHNAASHPLKRLQSVLDDARDYGKNGASLRLEQRLAEARALVDVCKITIARAEADHQADEAEDSAKFVEAQSAAAKAIAEALQRHRDELQNQQHEP